MSTGKYFWLLSVGAASIALWMPAPASAQEAVMLERPVATNPPDADKTKRTNKLNNPGGERGIIVIGGKPGATKTGGGQVEKGIVVIDGKPTPGAAQGIVVIGGKSAPGATQGIIVQNPGTAQGIIMQNPGTPGGFTTPGGSPGTRTK